MEIVYLGLLSSIFNAIFNAILSPIFKFLSSLLETVLGWLFENVLGPLLEKVLWPIFTGLLDLIFEILAEFIYKLLASVLQIVDAMQAAFNIFAGLQPVSYDGYPEPLPLIEMLFRVGTIQWAVMIITIIGFCLTLVFAVLGTARSMLELDVDNARPISRVLKSTGGAMARFALIPITCLFLIMMSGNILEGISAAMGTNETTLSRMVFVVSSLDANKKDARYNISGKLDDDDKAVTPASDIGIHDSYRKPFYTGQSNYADADVVGNTFNFARFDYLIGFGGAIFLLIIMAICLINFICRIFEVLMLFIASPIFVSVMPLDDGEKFKAWQDMFVAKVFSGFGSVIAMQLYMLLCPVVMSGKISFMQNGSAEADYLIRMIFMLGGAWAVIKAGPTITQLLNYQAGATERETGMAVTAGMIGAASFAGSAARQAFTGIRGMAAARSAVGESAREASNRRISKLLNGTGGGRTGTGSGSGSAARSGTGSGSGSGSGAGSWVSGNRPKAAAGRRSGIQIGARPTTTSGTGSASQKSALGKAGRVGTLGKNGHITVNTSKGGHHYLGVDYGKKLSFGRDQDGNFQFRVFGMGYRTGKDGKVDKVSLPFVRFKRGDDGFKVSKVKIAGAVNFKRSETVTTREDGTVSRQMGKMYCSDVRPLGVSLLQRRFDQDTGQVETLQRGVSHYGKNSQGEYVLTRREGLGIRTEYEQDDSGKNRISHVDVGSFSAKVTSDASGNRHIDKVKAAGGKEIYRSKESAQRAEQKRGTKKESDQ